MIRLLSGLKFLDLIWILFLSFHLLPVVPEYVPIAVRVVSWGIVLTGFLSKTSFRDVLRIVPLYSIAFLHILYSLFQGADNILELLYSYLQLFTISFAFIYIDKNDDSRFAVNTLKFAALFLVITAVTTIVGNSIYPGASRVLASSKNDAQMYHPILRMNVGGFDFTYMLVLIVPFLVYSVKNRTLPVIPAVLVLLLSCGAIIYSEYTFAIIFMMIGLLSFFFPRRLWRKSILPIAVVIVIIYMLFRSFLPSALEAVAARIDSEVVTERLQDMSLTLQGKEVENGSDLGSRIDLMKKSIDAFESDILFGSYHDVGGHSFILDALGRYGLLGLTGLVLMILTYYKVYMRPLKEEPYYGYFFICIVIYSALVFLNPQPFYIAVSLIVPLLFKYAT